MVRILLILIVFIYGCGTQRVSNIEENIKRDTLYIPKIEHDSFEIKSKPEIICLTDTFFQIKPYLASLDTEINIDKKDIKIRMEYSVPANEFDLSVHETKIDSTPVIINTRETTKTLTESYERPWYEYFILGAILLIGVLVGFFLGKIGR